VSKKYGLEKTTIRKWFANNKKYLPNYEAIKDKLDSEIWESLTEDSIKIMFENYKKATSRG
jgi:hypothetical protein